jgi:arylformamidase
MIIRLKHQNNEYYTDLSRPLDISVAVDFDREDTLAWYIDPPKREPVQIDGFIGSVQKGGSVNFFNLHLNPHAHGTHTETSGHINLIPHSVNKHFKTYHSIAELTTIYPEKRGEDKVITKNNLERSIKYQTTSLIIRTEPNTKLDKTSNFSNTNPPFFSADALATLALKRVENLLVDLPSVDKEQDGGKLLGHRAFWNHPSKERLHCTITELIYIPNKIPDGLYLLNLQVAPMENDAAPSRPLLFKLNPA